MEQLVISDAACFTANRVPGRWANFYRRQLRWHLYTWQKGGTAVGVRSVTILDLGLMSMDHSQFFWNAEAGTLERFPCYGVLIDHSDGLFLFDSGFDMDIALRKFPQQLPQREPDQTLGRQLALVGCALGDIDVVINSHLHFDHVGGNKLLPNAKLIVNGDEYAHFRSPQSFETVSYSDRGIVPGTGKICEVYSDYTVADGLELVGTAGHSAGHWSLLVSGPAGSRTMFFTGDAAFRYENIERSVIGGFHQDPTRAVDALQRIATFGEDSATDIYPSHDLQRFEGWRRAPEKFSYV